MKLKIKDPPPNTWQLNIKKFTSDGQFMTALLQVLLSVFCYITHKEKCIYYKPLFKIMAIPSLFCLLSQYRAVKIKFFNFSPPNYFMFTLTFEILKNKFAKSLFSTKFWIPFWSPYSNRSIQYNVLKTLSFFKIICCLLTVLP